MRTIIVVGALVAGLHALIWISAQREVSAPDFIGQFPSVSYTPFDGSAHPDSGSPTTTRTDPRRPVGARSLYPHRPHLFVDQRLGADSRGSPPNLGLRTSVGAWLDRSEERNERELQAVIDLARSERSIIQHRGRQRDHLSRRPRSRRSHREDSAGQTGNWSAGHHRRNLARLAGPPGAGIVGRFHLRAYPALLGGHLRPGGR